jgi:hypothetical protein
MVTTRSRKVSGRAREDHGVPVHAPFRVTTHRGHTMRIFESLESAIEVAASLGPDHHIIDRHGLQIWNPERKLNCCVMRNSHTRTCLANVAADSARRDFAVFDLGLA